MPVKATPAVVVAQTWQTIFNSEFRYYSWTGTKGFYPGNPAVPVGVSGSGSQIWVPVALSTSGRVTQNLNAEIGLRGGYVWSRQSTPGASGQVSTATDTGLSTTFTYTGFNGIQPYLAVQYNLPTGKSAVLGTSPFARMDPDLVGVATFGEGFNIGPTLGANITLSDSWMLGLGVGYTSRGSFDRETGINVTTTNRMNPGDLYTGNASLTYRDTRLVTQFSFSYTTETTTTINGVATFQTGDRYSASAYVSYAWTDTSTTVVNASWMHINSNKVVPPASLATEAFNSNNDIFTATIDQKFKAFQYFTVGPTGGFMYRDKNAWNPTTLTFVPAKSKWSFGGLAEYAVNPKATINMRVEHIWIRENTNPGPLAPATPVWPDLTANGWQAFLGGTVTF
jgi:hypothetical protein